MIFFLNPVLISLHTVPTPQNNPYDNRKAYFDNLKHSVQLSDNSPSVQVLHQQIKGWGVKTCADLADAGGGQNLGKPADVILERSLKCFSLTLPDHFLMNIFSFHFCLQTLDGHSKCMTRTSQVRETGFNNGMTRPVLLYLIFYLCLQERQKLMRWLRYLP